MVVAIDGPAGVGKSTVARESAEKAGFLYINSGSFYRAITLAVIEDGVDAEDDESVLRVARSCVLDVRGDRLTLNGRDVERLLHGDAVDALVARLSSIPELRSIVNARLRGIASRRDVVMEGRDIGTVVFPDAEVKIFLDADVKTRAMRRHAQGVSGLPLAQIEAAIEERDRIDRNKPTGRLAAADGALRIDTSHLTIDQVCERVIKTILVNKNNPGDIRRI